MINHFSTSESDNFSKGQIHLVLTTVKTGLANFFTDSGHHNLLNIGRPNLMSPFLQQDKLVKVQISKKVCARALRHLKLEISTKFFESSKLL